MSDRIVRIGGASGAWGDSPMAIAQLLTEPVDYLIMDYLAEVTMSLLAKRVSSPRRLAIPQTSSPIWSRT
jgi:hypothetical protein